MFFSLVLPRGLCPWKHAILGYEREKKRVMTNGIKHLWLPDANILKSYFVRFSLEIKVSTLKNVIYSIYDSSCMWLEFEERTWTVHTLLILKSSEWRLKVMTDIRPGKPVNMYIVILISHVGNSYVKYYFHILIFLFHMWNSLFHMWNGRIRCEIFVRGALQPQGAPVAVSKD